MSLKGSIFNMFSTKIENILRTFQQCMSKVVSDETAVRGGCRVVHPVAYQPSARGVVRFCWDEKLLQIKKKINKSMPIT